MGNKKLAILFFLSVILAFFAGYFSSTVIENETSVYSSDMFTSITDAFQEFYYYDIEDEEVNRAFIASMEAIIDQYAEDNNDPYTRLQAIPVNITPSDTEVFVGLGITFQMNQNNELIVVDVMLESDAYGKIYPNDSIIGIVIGDDTIMFNTLIEDEVYNYLSGVENEEKQLIVLNPDLELQTIDVTYRRILTPTAYTKDLDHDDIAYIKITEFSGYERGVTIGTSQVFNTLLARLEQQTLTDETKTLIIDLRDNPGGALTALNNPESSESPGITQQLLTNNPTSPLFTMTDNEGNTTSYFGRLTELKAYDIKVLVNEYSASAAEVLAAALMSAGYDLYGAETYGKGVYQNTIFLQNIFDVAYYLTYTEGTWQYGDHLNVSETPLQVNTIETSGMHTINMPIYGGEVGLDEVSAYLVNYQHFLNVYFDFEENELIRTDGYFDSATEQAIILFQQDMSLTETGILDEPTAQHIFTYYKEAINDIQNDTQLQTLIALIEGLD